MTSGPTTPADRETICGAPHPTRPSASCVLPAGHAGDHQEQDQAHYSSAGPAAVVALPEELASRTKICPQCAEEVKAAALVCRFCAHRFDAPLEDAGNNAAPAPVAAVQAIAQMTLDSVVMVVGAVFIAIGSIGPWATSPITSASGTSGDGVITLIAAIVLAGAAILSNGRILACLAILVAGGVGIYDLIHIHDRLQSVTLGGVQLDHVGWGLYVIVVGAVIALGGLLKRPTPADDVEADADTAATEPMRGPGGRSGF